MRRTGKLTPNLICEIIFAIVMLVFLLVTQPGRVEQANNMNSLWANGTETTGTLIKVKQKLTDNSRTIFQLRSKLKYEIGDENYETDCILSKKDFKKLDEDKDGKVSVNLRYDPADPSNATIEPAVREANKVLKYAKRFMWAPAVLAVLGVLLLPFVVKLDMMN